jgi:hypothetical protein
MSWKLTYANVGYLAATEWLIGETDAGGGFAFQAAAFVYKGSDGYFHANAAVLLSVDLAVSEGGTGASTAAGARTNLGLGSAALASTGTSGNALGFLNAANVWSALQTFATSVIASGASGAAQLNDRSTGATDAWLLYASGGTLRFFQQNGLADRITISANGVAVAGSVRSSSYTVGTLPSASGHGAGAIIYVSNEAGGATTAFSDGTNWRRHSDRAVVA